MLVLLKVLIQKQMNCAAIVMLMPHVWKEEAGMFAQGTNLMWSLENKNH